MTIHYHKAAGIDLGSNTFRLLVAKNLPGGGLAVLAKKMATVRLGCDLEKSGLLHKESMQKGFEVLRSFRKTLDGFQPRCIRVCGTEALRRAGNSRIFLHQAEGILQHAVEIISGEEEARLSLQGALSGYREPPAGPLLLVNAGGGSTELLFAESPQGKTRIQTVGLGVIGLTDRFLAKPQPDIDKLDSLLAEILGAALRELDLFHKPQPVLIMGCGGTATSMAALDLKLSSYNESMVHGHTLNAASIEKLWRRLIMLPAEKRNELSCLGEGRGEILPAGIRIYHVLLKLFQQSAMRVSDSGTLEGILLSGLLRGGAGESFPDRCY